MKFKYRYFLLIPLVGIILVFWWQLLSLDKPGYKFLQQFLHGMLMTIGIWSGCMAIVSYLWKKFPWEYQPLKHLVYEAVGVIIYTLLFSLLLIYIEKKTNFLAGYKDDLVLDLSISILITLLITSVHEAYFFYKQWKLNFSKSIKLEKDNIQVKYEALKSQINPHFLFNSLNSLVTMVEGNEKAENYIIDLSDFLRYILKSREREVVLLREELEILSKYSNIQQSRFGENLSININVDEKYFHYALPPLVLQMLVENAIKHNVISKLQPLLIKIQAKNENIVIENNLQERICEVSTGNGLNNIIERYAFLTSKKVEIKKTSNKFTVTVPLVLVDL